MKAVAGSAANTAHVPRWTITPSIDEIVRKVRSLIAEHLGVRLEEVTCDASIAELGADSLDRVAVVLALEDEFDIDIPDEAGIDITTVRQAIDYVAQAVERRTLVRSSSQPRHSGSIRQR